MTRESFHRFITDPATAAKLSAMLADNASVDAAMEKSGPRQCCPEFASVIACDGETDTWECGACSRVWDAPCQ